jgi:hypothetical protein
MNKRSSMLLILATGGVLVLGACDIEDNAAEEDAVVQAAAPNTLTAPTTTAVPAAGPTPDPDAETAVLMPDVVCMDLQYAQDTIQDAGVWLSRSVDATGQGRMQVMDRNWTVVAQTPAPGTPIGEGEAVMSVVKDDEPNNC